MLCSSSVHFDVTHIEGIDVRSVQDFIEDGSLCFHVRPSHSAKSVSLIVDRKFCEKIRWPTSLLLPSGSCMRQQ